MSELFYDKLLEYSQNDSDVCGYDFEDLEELLPTGVYIPEAYILFMEIAGKEAGRILRGTTYGLKCLADLQAVGRRMAGRSNAEIPDDAFIFATHQGYAFYFVRPDGVYSWLELDDHFDKLADSFEDYIESLIDQ